MDLTDRIKLIMKVNNLSASQFADEIGVQRSSMSHVLSGRNKPSLDLIMKTLNRFQNVSADWLVSGRKKMVETTPEVEQPAKTPESPEQTELPDDGDTARPKSPAPSTAVSSPNKAIQRIVVFYSDHTFEEYKTKN